MAIKRVLCLILGIYLFNNLIAQNNLRNLVSNNGWDSLFPKRAGTFGTHPQGYTSDFYSYNNLKQAINEMSDYFVVIRTKSGVWGQLITISRKSSAKSYVFSNVESWWYTNSTPETIVIVDFETFINESSLDNNKRELAAFLANISKETTGGWQLPVGGGASGDYAQWGLYFVHELGYTNSNSAGTYSQSSSEYPPNPNVGYYGRGPIQLSWNYNYGQFSKFIYNDKNILLNYPDSIKENGVLAFKSAIWFWMMPQCPKPSCHQIMHDQWKNDSSYSSSRMYFKGFAHTNNIINGGLECRKTSTNAFTQKVTLRSDLYKFYLGILGFKNSQIRKEDSADYSTLCYASSSDAMEDYAKCNTINSTYGSFGIDSVVNCGSFKWIDNVLYTTNTNVKYHIIKGGDIKGKDSIVFLNLKIRKNSEKIQQFTSCDSFTWINNKTYYSSNDSVIYNIKGGAYNGCDSVIRLKLKILKSLIKTDTVIACDSFKWINNKTYDVSTDSAIYKIKGGAYNGCDSVIRLKLKILKSSIKRDAVIACDSFTWVNNNTYYSSIDSVVYRIKGGAYNGCDSVTILKLKILKPSIKRDTVFACDSYTWINNKTYNESTDSDIYKIKGGAYNGCDSATILSLKILKTSIKRDTVFACNSYTWIDGNTYYNSADSLVFKINSGSYNGCDSILNLKLTINKLDLNVVKQDNKLIATSFANNYQWLNCDDNFSLINGASSNVLNLSKNGSYSCFISNNFCSDTTECVLVEDLYVNTNSIVSKIKVFPNPSKNMFYINSSNLKDTNFEVFNCYGKLIIKGRLKEGVGLVSLNDYEKGVYFLRIDIEQIVLLRN